MKKLLTGIVLVVLLVFCSGSMTACNGGFELVNSISITTNGEVKKFNSSGPGFSLSSQTNISEEEFSEAPLERKLYDKGSSGLIKFSKITVYDAIKDAKNSTHYEVVEDELKGDWYFNRFDMETKKWYFWKCSYKNTSFHFVYVKVKNDTTVIIKNSSFETTYTVTSYTITKFN